MATIAELLGFLWKKKQWWLLPIVISLLMLGILLTLASSSPLGTFMYTIF
jgi:drug/metabolite transporter superfamily protein YnfA